MLNCFGYGMVFSGDNENVDGDDQFFDCYAGDGRLFGGDDS